MLNLLIALGFAVAGYILGAMAAGWIAGFLPALLVLGVAWALLARRTSQALAPLMAKAQEAMQAQNFAGARAILESGFPLARWQFLIAEQLHLQLGSIDYLESVMQKMQKQPAGAQAALARAHEHFEQAAVGGWKGYLLGWQGRALLAATLHREGKTGDGIQLCADAGKYGRTDPVFWGLYAWLLTQAQRRDDALLVLAEGLKAHDKAAPLLSLQEQLSNGKPLDMKVFGETWYQFFPEDMMNDPKVIELARAQQQRAERRGGQMTWPQPRR